MCQVFLVSMSCSRFHGVGEVHTAIRLKTANHKEHFRVRGHICQKFFKCLYTYKIQFIAKLATPFA